ncbi:hypothetical protein DFH07DRAFT_766465 [Mycena maculata]|uniref:Uncharacterized protein n=1 Tax=Mycena maculata TaxID=230809 RepID=A0AAD7K2A9_9AGAR|nr:hypothetical protein DFH07DRAFT_766465 [Mycena maculata]
MDRTYILLKVIRWRIPSRVHTKTARSFRMPSPESSHSPLRIGPWEIRAATSLKRAKVNGEEWCLGEMYHDQCSAGFYDGHFWTKPSWPYMATSLGPMAIYAPISCPLNGHAYQGWMCYLQVFWWLLLYNSWPGADYAYLGHPELSEEVQQGGGPDSGTELVKDVSVLSERHFSLAVPGCRWCSCRQLTGTKAWAGVRGGRWGQAEEHIRTIGVDHYIPRVGRFEAKQNGSPFSV